MVAGDSIEIKGYQILQELGAGAFGKVYYATKNGCSYAVKRIDIGLQDEADKIMQEIQCHRRLSHPNVIQYYEDFKIDTAVWIVMEYCNGGDLNSWILKQLPSYGTLLDITKQICHGVDYLHSQNVTHRDLKPDNIMICFGPYGYILKIADFGLSRLWECFSYQSPYYEFNYGPKGPQFYSAPEIMNGIITIKSDIFSLGCIILAIFTRTTVPWIGGKHLLAPYIGYPPLQIADANEYQKISYIQQYVKLPCGGDEGRLQDLVFGMLQHNWRERPNAGYCLELITLLQVAPYFSV